MTIQINVSEDRQSFILVAKRHGEDKQFSLPVWENGNIEFFDDPEADIGMMQDIMGDASFFAEQGERVEFHVNNNNGPIGSRFALMPTVESGRWTVEMIHHNQATNIRHGNFKKIALFWLGLCKGFGAHGIYSKVKK